MGATSVPVLSEKQVSEYRELRVDAALTSAVQAATGDTALVVVFSASRGCFGLASKRPVRVLDSSGKAGNAEQFMAVPWKWWRDDDTSAPLAPLASAMADYCVRCDGFRHRASIIAGTDAVQEERERSAVAAEVDRGVAALELAKNRIARHADALGIGIASAR